MPASIMHIPEGFPSVIFPEGNEYTYQRWALGKRLFYDPIMSKQNTVSCASCHIAQNAFSDTISFSIGDNAVLGKSNAPTLTNIGYHPYYTRAGGVPTLEMQILVPIQEHDEFNTNILDIVERLNNIPSYVEQSIAAYDRVPDAFMITRAIANFERSLISGNSPYDQFQFQGKANALNTKEKKGKELFYSSRTNCSQCHNGFNFTNYSFENNGIPPNSLDSGRMRLTKDETDRDKFKVPTLRNIVLTAPYMHDGRFKTLEEVVANYNSGGTPHKNKSEFIKPLGLSSEEQQELIAFLKALTDQTFINNQNFKQ
ncbi:MAG: cytochrome c peroxidase [Bacteroidota bacterium]